MEDTDHPRHPADSQHRQTVLPGRLQLPLTRVLAWPVDQVDALQDVRYSVPQAHDDVKENYLEDDQGSKGPNDGVDGGEASGEGEVTSQTYFRKVSVAKDPSVRNLILSSMLICLGTELIE